MSPPSAERLELLRSLLAQKGLQAPHASAIPRRPGAGAAPLSFAQERLYFLEAYQPGTALYNDTVLVRIRGALERDAFARALAALQERHELLRTSFELTASGPLQRIHARTPLPLVEADLRGAPESERLARERVEACARAPFALEVAPVWRALLLRVADAQWCFACTMHHIASDGASFGLFMRELSELYAAAQEGRPPRLAPLAIQFADYAAWERTALDEERAAEHLAYWTRILAGELPAPEWPAGDGTPSNRGASIALCFAPRTGAALVELARAERTTTNQLLLTAWLALLGASSGATDVRTGVASSLRRRTELEPLIGFFVQTLVLRVSLADDPDFRTLAARVRALALEAEAHAALPYDRVARAVERNGGVPLLPTYFSHMRDALCAPRLAGAHCSWEFVDALVARFGLALVLHESEQELRGLLEFDQALVPRAEAELLAADYARLIEAALARPELRFTELAAQGCARLRVRRRSSLSLPIRPRRAVG